MKTQILPTRQAKTRKCTFLVLCLLRFSVFGPVCHETFQLGKRFLDLWDRPGAVYEFPFGRIELVGNSELQS